MTDTPTLTAGDVCLRDIRPLYDAIMERMTGRKVQSAGHKDRNVSYADASLSDMLKLYAQLWAQCGADAGLPELKQLDAPVFRRGRPFRVRFGF